MHACVSKNRKQAETARSRTVWMLLIVLGHLEEILWSWCGLTKLLVSQLQQPLSNEFFSGKPFLILIANKEKKTRKTSWLQKKSRNKNNPSAKFVFKSSSHNSCRTDFIFNNKSCYFLLIWKKNFKIMRATKSRFLTVGWIMSDVQR